MSDAAQLMLPPVSLAGCVFAAIVRDTRERKLCDLERYNHFPASPLIALTFVFEGEVRIVEDHAGLDVARAAKPQQPISIAGAQASPVTSWNPGTVFAITIGIYPDAWLKLTGSAPQDLDGKMNLPVPEALREVIDACKDAEDVQVFWQIFCDQLQPLWDAAQSSGGPSNWAGKDRISNWSKSLLARAALASAGKSIRAVERRLRRWTGQSQQTLSFYARFEDLHRLSTLEQNAPLAGLAQDAGFADQSHMGRTVRRATGYSPAHLNALIAREEAFWCYRLLGERF